MGYKSINNLGLSQKPATDDPKLFGNLVPLYNAAHSLNAGLDGLSTFLTGSDPNKTVAESAAFSKFFWINAAQNLLAGQIISPFKGNGGPSGGPFIAMNGMIRGGRKMTFVALSDATVGNKVKVAIGPGVIQVTGVIAGDDMYCAPAIVSVSGGNSTLSGDGSLYLNVSPVGGFYLGMGVGDGFLLLDSNARV